MAMRDPNGRYLEGYCAMCGAALYRNEGSMYRKDIWKGGDPECNHTLEMEEPDGLLTQCAHDMDEFCFGGKTE